MAMRPDRHHASRRSSSVQAMAYTMATNRHITPKPGQGWRVWAEWWTLVSWPPAWVGQNSVTGFRHESGTARATPGSPSAAWGAWPLMRAWPTKNATKLTTSPTTKVTTAKTSDLAASTRPRFGTAIRLVRIIPEEYSELMQSTPSTAMASCAMAIPAWLTPVGSQLSFWETLNLA